MVLFSYFYFAVAYILLKIQMPNLRRPYKSPFGVYGAFFQLLLCGATALEFLILEPEISMSILVFVLKVTVAFGFFRVWGKPVDHAPEQIFILKQAVYAHRQGSRKLLTAYAQMVRESRGAKYLLMLAFPSMAYTVDKRGNSVVSICVIVGYFE